MFLIENLSSQDFFFFFLPGGCCLWHLAHGKLSIFTMKKVNFLQCFTRIAHHLALLIQLGGQRAALATKVTCSVTLEHWLISRPLSQI